MSNESVYAAAIGGFFLRYFHFGEKVSDGNEKRLYYLDDLITIRSSKLRINSFNNPLGTTKSLEITVGMKSKWIDEVHFKAQYSDRVVARHQPVCKEADTNEHLLPVLRLNFNYKI